MKLVGKKKRIWEAKNEKKKRELRVCNICKKSDKKLLIEVKDVFIHRV